MSDNQVKLKMDAATDAFLALGVDDGTTEDANYRYLLNADGKQEWGNGTDAVDTNLYRSGANTLATDDSLTVAGSLSVTGGVTATGGLTETVTTGSTGTTISNNGITTLPSTAAATYNLAAPTAGVTKTLFCTANTTTIQTVTTNSTSVFINGTTGTTLAFDGINDAVILKGLSATRWAIVSNVQSVAVA